MPHAVQDRAQVAVYETQRSSRRFTLPEAVLPQGCLKMMILCDDDIDELFSREECPKLYALCEALMPSDERCTQVDHVQFVQRTQSRTEVEVQLARDFTTSKAQGRVDAALKASGYEPVFRA